MGAKSSNTQVYKCAIANPKRRREQMTTFAIFSPIILIASLFSTLQE